MTKQKKVRKKVWGSDESVKRSESEKQKVMPPSLVFGAKMYWGKGGGRIRWPPNTKKTKKEEKISNNFLSLFCWSGELFPHIFFQPSLPSPSLRAAKGRPQQGCQTSQNFANMTKFLLLLRLTVLKRFLAKLARLRYVVNFPFRLNDNLTLHFSIIKALGSTVWYCNMQLGMLF